VKLIIALVAGVASAACSAAAHNVPGSLPGESHGAIGLTAAHVADDSVATDGTATSRTGTFTTFRYSAGALFTPTAFGTITGLEGTAALGWLAGDAAKVDDTHEGKSLYFETELGGVLQPFPFSRVVRGTVDYGIGYNVDDRYTYAGARLAIGPRSRTFLFDAGYRRHFGDTPGNPGAHEDRFRGWLTFRTRSKRTVFQLGFDYVRGDQRTLDDTGGELPGDDYLFRGRYELFAITLGYGKAADHPQLGGLH
jgi:hypothetical protein